MGILIWFGIFTSLQLSEIDLWFFFFVLFLSCFDIRYSGCVNRFEDFLILCSRVGGKALTSLSVLKSSGLPFVFGGLELEERLEVFFFLFLFLYGYCLFFVLCLKFNLCYLSKSQFIQIFKHISIKLYSVLSSFYYISLVSIMYSFSFQL